MIPKDAEIVEVDLKDMELTYCADDDSNVAEVIHIPWKWCICSTCDGHGKHSRDLGVITQEDREQNWSHEEWESYMAGGYDRMCEACSGAGKVKVPDYQAMPLWLSQIICDHEREERQYEAMCAAERRMGA